MKGKLCKELKELLRGKSIARLTAVSNKLDSGKPLTEKETAYVSGLLKASIRDLEESVEEL
jgi:hypothetical protein